MYSWNTTQSYGVTRERKSQGYHLTQEYSPAPQFESINSSLFSLVSGPALISVHDYWKNHNFDYMNLCRQSDISAF